MADYGKEEIAKILIKRDGITDGEALDIINECQWVINDILDSEMTDFEKLQEIEDTIEDYLGLEPDYIFAFLWGTKYD